MSIAIFIEGRGSVGTVTEASHRSSGQRPWLGVDWREHQRWVRVSDRWANVCEIGSGQPVLFVHGLGGAGEKLLGKPLANPQGGLPAGAPAPPGLVPPHEA